MLPASLFQRGLTLDEIRVSGILLGIFNIDTFMPTRQHTSRKDQNAAFAIRRKEAEFTRRKAKAIRMAKLEAKAKAK